MAEESSLHIRQELENERGRGQDNSPEEPIPVIHFLQKFPVFYSLHYPQIGPPAGDLTEKTSCEDILYSERPPAPQAQGHLIQSKLRSSQILF